MAVSWAVLVKATRDPSAETAASSESGWVLEAGPLSGRLTRVTSPGAAVAAVTPRTRPARAVTASGRAAGIGSSGRVIHELPPWGMPSASARSGEPARRLRYGQRPWLCPSPHPSRRSSPAPPPSSPTGEGWAYEPKWDGFRAIAFVDGGEVVLQSRGGRPLGRYFPELALPQGRLVVDGEIVVDGEDGRPDFEALQQRIHPAASRVALLAERTPARFVAFDLLALGDETLLERPFAERRAALAEVAAPAGLTPQASDRAGAEAWLREAEGVVAKRLDAPYRPGERHGMVKVKRVRTMDAWWWAGGRARPRARWAP